MQSKKVKFGGMRVQLQERVRDSSQIAELPGIALDESCIQKLGELEPAERNDVIQEYLLEDRSSGVRNPSGWLFGRARSRIVVRVSGGKGAAKGAAHSPILVSRVPLQRQREYTRGFSWTRHGSIDALFGLEDLGVDEQALKKLGEVPYEQLFGLLRQFEQLHGEGQIKDPSKWLFSKARTIAASRTQSLPPVVQPTTGHGGRFSTVPELEGIHLDSAAYEKLEELDPEERTEVINEYFTASAETPIRNPSGWIFGKARSKLCVRHTGGASRWTTPY